MTVAIPRQRRAPAAMLLLIACALVMAVAGATIYISAGLPFVKGAPTPSLTASTAAAAGEPEGFRFREGIAPLDAAEINASIPDSSEPILPARPFSILSSAVGGGNRLAAVDCLTAAIYYEAATESLTGQRSVAQVVLNRVRHPAYPNSVCGVVFQGSQRATGCQFTFTCDGSLQRRPSAAGWARARAVATAALSGFVETAVGTATHYHAVYVVPYWSSSLTKLRTIDSHIFYRWTGSNGRPSAFVDGYANSEIIPEGAAARLSGFLLAGSASGEALDITPVGPIVDAPDLAALDTSGLKLRSGGELSSAPATKIIASGGGLAVAAPELKSKDAEPKLLESGARLLD